MVGTTSSAAQAGPPEQTACSGNTCVTLAGSGDGTATPGHTVAFDFSLLITGGSVDNATFASDVGAGLLIDPASVRVNGATPTAAPVQHGHDITVALAPAALDNSGDTPEVSFRATVEPDALPYLQPSFAVTFRHGTSPEATATDTAVVQRPAPDFAPLYTGGTVLIGRGHTQSTDVNVDGDNPQRVRASVTLSFPAGFSFVPGSANDPGNDASKVPCTTTGSTTRCTFLPDQYSSGLAFQFAAAPDLHIGAKAAIGVDVEPVGQPDLHPGDNKTTIPIAVVGNARLIFRIAAPKLGVSATSANAKLVLPVGQRVLINIHVRNAGPDPSPATVISYGEEGTLKPGFVITDAAGHPLTANRFEITDRVGTIAVGQTVVRHLYITAERGGLSTVLNTNIIRSGAHLIGSYCPDPSCEAAAALLISTRSAIRTASTSSGGSEPLAATGEAYGPQAVTGAAAVALGLVLCMGGRRRRRRC